MLTFSSVQDLVIWLPKASTMPRIKFLSAGGDAAQAVIRPAGSRGFGAHGRSQGQSAAGLRANPPRSLAR